MGFAQSGVAAARPRRHHGGLAATETWCASSRGVAPWRSVVQFIAGCPGARSVRRTEKGGCLAAGAVQSPAATSGVDGTMKRRNRISTSLLDAPLAWSARYLAVELTLS